MDSEPKDWENLEEIPPEKLQKKWDREESAESPAVTCPECGKRVPATSFQCLYCGFRIFQDSGLLGMIRKVLKKIFN